MSGNPYPTWTECAKTLGMIGTAPVGWFFAVPMMIIMGFLPFQVTVNGAGMWRLDFKHLCIVC